MKSGNNKWKTLTGWDSIEGQWLRRKHFTAQALESISQRITQSEQQHTGELVVVIEGVMPAHESDSHLRALEVFGRLRAWDTPLNTGVLLYLALDKRTIEIIADRGVVTPQGAWLHVCNDLQTRLSQGEFIEGVLAAIDAIEQLLLQGCPPLPAGQVGRNDLPDAPVML